MHASRAAINATVIILTVDFASLQIVRHEHSLIPRLRFSVEEPGYEASTSIIMNVCMLAQEQMCNYHSLTHATVWESMGKPCRCMQVIKIFAANHLRIRIRYCKSSALCLNMQ